MWCVMCNNERRRGLQDWRSMNFQNSTDMHVKTSCSATLWHVVKANVFDSIINDLINNLTTILEDSFVA